MAEEASEFSGLTDITEGEMIDEKHVALYKVSGTVVLQLCCGSAAVVVQ